MSTTIQETCSLRVLVLASLNREVNIVTKDLIWEGLFGKKLNVFSLRESVKNLSSEKQKFHVIFCRNVMIYFDSETKRQLINRLYDATAEGGYLIVGHSETINRKETRYQSVIPAVYRKE